MWSYLQADDAIRLVLHGIEARHAHQQVKYPALGLNADKSSASIHSELYKCALKVVAAELATQTTPATHNEISRIIEELAGDHVMALASVRFLSRACYFDFDHGAAMMSTCACRVPIRENIYFFR